MQARLLGQAVLDHETHLSIERFARRTRAIIGILVHGLPTCKPLLLQAVTLDEKMSLSIESLAFQEADRHRTQNPHFIQGLASCAGLLLTGRAAPTPMIRAVLPRRRF